MYQAAKEKQTSKILLPLLSTWKKGTNHKWGGKGVTRQNGSYETKTIINTNTTIDTETKQIWKKGTSHKWGGKGVTRQNGLYETKTKTIINNKYDHRYRNKTNLKEGNQPQMGRQRFQF